MKKIIAAALALLTSSTFAYAGDISAITVMTEAGKSYQSGAFTDVRPEQDSVIVPQPASNPGSVEPAAGREEMQFAPDEMMEGRDAIKLLQSEPAAAFPEEVNNF